jgi:protein-tyrosine-phosphatase
LTDNFPQAASRVFTLKEFAEASQGGVSDEYNYLMDIADPYGMSLEAYKKCARDIHEAVKKVLQRLEGESEPGVPEE